MIKKMNEFLEKNIIIIFTIFLFMSPILDVITGIVLYFFNITFTFSSIIRVLFMLFCIYYIFFVKRKYKYLIILFIYSILFLLFNTGGIMYEIKLFLSIIYLPIILLFTYLIINDNYFEEKKLYKILLIYLILIFIPNIFNIGFNSYAYSKEGSVGFFYSANAVGCIISVLSPLFISYLIKEKKKLLLTLYLVMYIYVLFTLGTKAPLMCSFIILVYYIIYIFVKLLRSKKYKELICLFISLIILSILFITLLPSTPFYKNLLIHLRFLKIKKLSDLLTFKNIDHFIFSSRLTFFSNLMNKYLKSSIFGKLFGIGYVYNNKILKLSEMDFLDMFINQGIVGFIIIYYNYFKLIFNIFSSYVKKIKEYILNIKLSSYVIACIISMLCALLTGHVLSSPMVSIFICIVICISYKEIVGGNNEKR